ncbi:MAG: Amidase [Marmoricola sp.]|jgi:amidase|nr:Amidase [Marmoricola sp.]
MAVHEIESGPKTRVHAFTDDALGDHDAVGLVAELRAGRVSSAELVEAAINRTEKVNADLNGLACADFDRARRSAQTPGREFFGGMPTYIKDNCDVEGLPTQQGTDTYRARPAKADGALARNYFAQGFINLGKTQLSEFGFNPSGEHARLPPVRNPWHTDHDSGGSSAGSSVFVAAGVVPLAHATDGGGSIRIPAACNGLVGMKPSRGRVPTDKLMDQMPVRIVADGAVSRTVRDTAAYLREAEKVFRNPALPPIGDVTGPGRKRLRVAMVVDSIVGRTDDETAATVRRTAELLESLGHQVEEVAAPVTQSLIGDLLTYWAFLAAAQLASGKVTLAPSFSARRCDNVTRGLAGGLVRNPARLPLAIVRLRAAQRTSANFFRSYDTVLSPVCALVAPEIGYLNPNQPSKLMIDKLVGYDSFAPLQNVTGEPAISLPMGAAKNGVPIGIQLAAPVGRESRLLEVAYELERAQPFRRIQDA